MMLPERFARHLEELQLPPGPRVVAVSGGPDSMALLHLLAPLSPPESLVAAHIDHGIHPASGDAARLVERTAARLGVPCLVAELGLGSDASETEARRARYEALRAIADERGGVILTAHHRDDQVETVLIRVLGGSGIAGLAGMHAVTAGVVRPLLPFSRREIRDWAARAGIESWDDPANRDPRHLRSWIRQEVMPMLTGRIPDLDGRILRLARWARNDRAAWDVALDALGMDVRTEGDAVSMRRTPLDTFNPLLAAQLLQAAARRGGEVVGPVAAARLARLARGGTSGQQVDLGNGLIGEVAFDRVVLRPGRAVPLWEAVAIEGDSGILALGAWRCSWRTEPAPDRQERRAWTVWLTPGIYRIRAWEAGDRIFPLGGRGHRLVVRCMHDARLPRGNRPGWPVLVANGRVIWVPGVMRASDALPPAGSRALRVEIARS